MSAIATSPLHFGVVGLGRMGKRRINSIGKDHRSTLVCVSDQDRAAAESLAAGLACHVCDDAHQMLDAHPEMAAIVVALPNRFHRDVVVAALDSGRHVFCEKPLAHSRPDAVEMVEAQLRSDKTIKVGSNLRYFPNVLEAKRVLDAGGIGEPLFVRSWIGHSGWNLGDSSWYSDRDLAGGGTFLDNGVHVLDVVRWLLGEAVACVGLLGDRGNGTELERNAFGLFEMSRGEVVFVHSSWTEWAGYAYLEVYGSEGFVRIDARDGRSDLVVGSRDGQRAVHDYSDNHPSSFDAEFDHYLTSLLNGDQPTASGLDGLRAVDMAFGVYDAVVSGSRVSLWGDTSERLAARYANRSSPSALVV
ncbi:MAG: Gfo/Idh/MocA family protein [Acidimicrobiales bacterium]